MVTKLLNMRNGQSPVSVMMISARDALFLDGILMDIMIYNGEIWCKLSALVMVYIH